MRQTIYFRSDFELLCQGLDADKQPLNLWDLDFDLYLFTVGAERHKVSHHGTEWTGCYVDEAERNVLHICVNSPNLVPGMLSVESHMYVPDPRFADGVQDIKDIMRTDIELTTNPSDYTMATVSLSVPWYMYSDTDAYNDILQKVNDSLEEILGSTPSTPSTVKAAKAWEADTVLTSGMMRIGARPGAIYNSHVGRPSKDIVVEDYGLVLFPRRPDDKWWYYGDAFPNGLFYDRDIEFRVLHRKIAYDDAAEISEELHLDIDRDGCRVRLTGATGDSSPAVLVALVRLGGHSPYLMKNKSGRIVSVPEPLPVPELPEPTGTKFDLWDGDENKWAYAVGLNGERYELQWLVRHKARPVEARNRYKFYTGWHFARVRNIHYRGGIFRLRRRTSSGRRGPWVVFTRHRESDKIARVKK